MAEEMVHKGIDPLGVVLFCWSFGCLLGMRNAEPMKSPDGFSSLMARALNYPSMTSD